MQEFEESGQVLVDLGSDQTSCHDPYSGGYYPVGLSYEESQKGAVTARSKSSEPFVFMFALPLNR